MTTAEGVIYCGVAAVLIVAGLFALGLGWLEGQAEAALPLIGTALLWPAVLGALLLYGVVSAPYWFGVYTRKRRVRIEEAYQDVRKMIGADG